MVGGGRGDDTDAAVAQPDQMIRHHPPRRLFGGRYGEAGRGGGAGDARAGQLHLRQPVEQRLVVGQRRHQQHAIGAQRRDQPVEHVEPFLPARRQRLHHQMIAQVPAPPRGPHLDAADIAGRGVVVEEGDHEGSAAGQPPRRLVGAIAQLLDRRLHARAQFLADIGRLVDHARHRLDRDFGKGGDVVDAGHGSWLMAREKPVMPARRPAWQESGRGLMIGP